MLSFYYFFNSIFIIYMYNLYFIPIQITIYIFNLKWIKLFKTTQNDASAKNNENVICNVCFSQPMIIMYQ